MKLIVLLDKRHIKRVKNLIEKEGNLEIFTKEELLYDIEEELGNVKCHIVKDENFPSKNICKNYTETFYKIKDKNFEEIIEPHINDMYTYLIKPAFKILYSIKTLISNSEYEEVVLLGGNRHFYYLPFYFSESQEDERRFLHNSSWFFNRIIYENFFKKIKIRFLYEENLFSLNLIKRLREILIFLVSFLLLTIKHIKYSFKQISKRKKIKKKIDNLNNLVIFPVRTVHQCRFVKNIILALNRKGFNSVMVFYEGLRAKNVSQFINNTNLKDFLYPLYGFGELLSIFITFIEFSILITRDIFSDKKKMYIKNENFILSIPVKEVKIEAKIGIYYFIYTRLFEKFLRVYFKNVKFIASTEMRSKEAFLERYVAKKFNLKFINLQTASFENDYLPVVSVGDIFFVESLKEKNSLKDKGIKNKGKIEYVGLIKYSYLPRENEIKRRLPDKPEKILYITQPTTQFASQRIANKLFEIGEKDNINIVIKLHPRDRVNLYKRFIKSKNITLITSQAVDLESLIRSSHLVVAKTSSVLKESLILGIPYISCLFTEEEKGVKLDFILPSLVAYNERDMAKFIKEFKDTKEKFFRERERYLNENKILIGEESVQLFLSSIEGV